MGKRIHVTQEDIREGTPNSGSMCPVALAISRELGVDTTGGTSGYISVTQEYIFVRRDGEWEGALRAIEKAGYYKGDRIGTWYKNQPEVTSFIVAFDEGREVEPFEFEMKKFSQAKMREMMEQ
jgi:hypothetical protein